MQDFSTIDFKKKLRATRKKKFRTQEKFCKVLGIKRSTYARYETDTYPPLPMLYKICKTLNVSADFLLEPFPIETEEEQK